MNLLSQIYFTSEIVNVIDRTEMIQLIIPSHYFSQPFDDQVSPIVLLLIMINFYQILFPILSYHWKHIVDNQYLPKSIYKQFHIIDPLFIIQLHL